MLRDFRKPLIVITPKTLLRLPTATSALSDMAPSNYFRPVISEFVWIPVLWMFFNPFFLDENVTEPSNINRVLLTSGKHYYTLHEKRKQLNAKNTAIVRIESFCPFPTMELQEELSKYKNAKGYTTTLIIKHTISFWCIFVSAFIWCQEEPRNMGAWSFIKPRFVNLIGYPVKSFSISLVIELMQVFVERDLKIPEEVFSFSTRTFCFRSRSVGEPPWHVLLLVWANGIRRRLKILKRNRFLWGGKGVTLY